MCILPVCVCVCVRTAASLPQHLMADYYNAWREYNIVYVIYEPALIGLGPAMLGQKRAPVGLSVFSTGGKNKPVINGILFCLAVHTIEIGDSLHVTPFPFLLDFGQNIFSWLHFGCTPFLMMSLQTASVG